MSSSLVTRAKWVGGVTLLCCTGLVGLAWVEREHVLARYYVRGYLRATDGDRDAWAERLVRLGRPAVAALVGCLCGQGSRDCDRASSCLTQLVRGWGADDPRAVAVAERLAAEFPHFSAAGQVCAVRLEHVLGQLVKGTSAPASLVRSAAAVLAQAGHVADSEVRADALELALSRLGRAKTDEMVSACRELARAALRDDAPNNRVRALRLALLPGIDLADQAVNLLRDPTPDVRRAAMLEVGPNQDLIPTDGLLHWLHDPDADVRDLCEAALRGRGLRDEQIKMGRLMTDGRVSVRLRVLDYLRSNSEVEPGVWLRRLSHDPAPAVRAATVRAATAESAVDLSDRVEQMVQNDPSPTVRQLARFYLSCRKSE